MHNAPWRMMASQFEEPLPTVWWLRFSPVGLHALSPLPWSERVVLGRFNRNPSCDPPQPTGFPVHLREVDCSIALGVARRMAPSVRPLHVGPVLD